MGQLGPHLLSYFSSSLPHGGTALAQGTGPACPQPPPGSLASQMAKSDPAPRCDADLGRPTGNYVAPNNFWDNDAMAHDFYNALDKVCEA